MPLIKKKKEEGIKLVDNLHPNLHLLRFRLSLFTDNALLISFMSLPTKRSIFDNNAAVTTMSSSTATSIAHSHPPIKTKNRLQHHPQSDCNLNPCDDVIFNPKSMALDDDLKANDPIVILNAHCVMLLQKLKSAICAICLKQPDSCDLENLY